MNLHVKILLFLAAYPVELVLTGNGGSCFRQLGQDDLEDDHAFASTQSRPEPPNHPIGSPVEQNAVIDENSESTQIIQVDDQDLRPGKPVVNHQILIPDHLENNPEKINDMKMDCGSFLRLIDELPTLVTPLVLQKCEVSEQRFLSVHQALRNYLRRYILKDDPGQGEESARSHFSIAAGSSPQNPTQLSGVVVKFGSQKTSLIIHELEEIIHSIKFPPPSHYQNMAEDLQRDVLHVKTNLEKCVFKILGYLYRFKLITEDEMNSFFKNPETLELTARHLPDLFSIPKDAFYGPRTFIPDLNLILNDPFTVHLHSLVEGLEPEVQGALMYKTLQIASQIFDHARAQFPHIPRNRNSISTNKAFFQESFLDRFRNWKQPPRGIEDENKDVTEAMTNAVYLFQNYRGQHNLPRDIERADILLNYYFLRFIEMFANSEIQSLIRDKLVLKEQLTWTRAVLVIRQRAEKYSYLFEHPQEASKVFPLQRHEKRLRENINGLRFAETLLSGGGDTTVEVQNWRKANALAQSIEDSLRGIESRQKNMGHLSHYLAQSNSWLVQRGTRIEERSAK